MENQIYAKKNFYIICVDHEYVVVNKLKEFSSGHTHIKSFKTAKYLIDMVLYKRIPYHLSQYLLVSLQRLSDDVNYINKIQELINKKSSHKQVYCNRSI